MKFTFKTANTTGKYRAFFQPDIYIRINKKVCGMIDTQSPFKIRLMVIKKDLMEDGNPNCIWKWVVLKKQSESIREAKDYLNENIKLIRQQFTLYCFEPNN